MKHCPYCHVRLYENDDYCLFCGRRLKKVKTIPSYDHIQQTISRKEMNRDLPRAIPSKMDPFKQAYKDLGAWQEKNYGSKMSSQRMNELNAVSRKQNRILAVGVLIFTFGLLIIRLVIQMIRFFL